MTTMTRPTTSVHLMTDDDVLAAYKVELLSYDHNPWTVRHFRRLVGSVDWVAVKGVVGGRLAGYLFATVDVKNNQIRLRNVAVHPEFRRQGVATTLVETVTEPGVPPTVWGQVRESNLDAQLWLRATGFKWFRTDKRGFRSPIEDAYWFYRETTTE
jgi:ribosomal protein S18 acetylase RimI-like enzyme